MYPERRLAQKALAHGATEVVHGKSAAEKAETLSALLFDRKTDFKTLPEETLEDLKSFLPKVDTGTSLLDALLETSLVSSKKEARTFLAQGAISVNGEKVSDETRPLSKNEVIKKGKNKFLVVK